MKIEPYRIRLGHHDQEGKKFNWINELGRYSSTSQKYARCSFYVPVLTPIVVAIASDSDDNSNALSISAPSSYQINIKAGSVSFNDTIPNGAVRLYGCNVSTTPYQGKDVALVASEETIEITITDAAGERTLAAFEYKHLECNDAPEDVELGQIHFDENVEPWAYGDFTRISKNINEGNTSKGPEDDEIIEIDELSSSDEVVEAEESIKKVAVEIERKIPNTPTSSSKRAAPQTSLTPQFKTLGRESKPRVIKAEMLEIRLSPSKPPSPAHTIKKDAELKLAALRRQLEAAKDETKKLGAAKEKKETKAKTACERAIQRAQVEHQAAVQRNREMKEELEIQLTEQCKTLDWINNVIKDNTEIIELSDDSDSEATQLPDDFESDQDNGSGTSSPPKRARSNAH